MKTLFISAALTAIVLSIAGSFYWFGYRPQNIRKDCFDYALEMAVQKVYDKKKGELRYTPPVDLSIFLGTQPMSETEKQKAELRAQEQYEKDKVKNEQELNEILEKKLHNTDVLNDYFYSCLKSQGL